MDYQEQFASKIAEIKKQGNYRVFKNLDRKRIEKSTHYHFDGKKILNFTSNDYLGISTNYDVVEAALEAIKERGLGSGGTRNISGSNVVHVELEALLSHNSGCEKSILFNSAYIANITLLATISKLFPEVIFFSDQHNHASLIDGMKHYNAKKIVYKHADIDDLENKISTCDSEVKVIVTESVYSMHGTIPDLKRIVAIAKKYNAMVVVDEVHAVGLYGKNGAGITEELGIIGECDFIIGTLGKAYGLIGGYIAGKEHGIDAIRSFGRGFIFTTSLPPFLCSAAIEAVKFSSEHTELRQKFWKNVKSLKGLLKEKGISVIENKSHVIPVPINDNEKCYRIAHSLMNDYGIYLQAINYPTVEKGRELLRIAVNSNHSKEELTYLADSLQKLLLD